MNNPERCSRRNALLLFFLLNLTTMGTLASAQSRREIDVAKSVLTVRVYKTGLFSAFAHDHEVRAPFQSGSFDEQQRAVEFKVDARELKVLDPGVSDSDRNQVQHTMQGPKVLDSEQFKEIAYVSTSIEPAGQEKWKVKGNLRLHGQTRPVEVEVEKSNGHYRGSAKLRQTDFGITPVSIGGGSIKVKDEVRIEFDIAGK
jgi:polyisoprenoid-binding protein YceI